MKIKQLYQIRMGAIPADQGIKMRCPFRTQMIYKQFRPTLFGLGVTLWMIFDLLVFFSGGHAAADVALGFVLIQYMAHLPVQELVVLR